MKVTINFGKKHLFVFLGVFLLLAGGMFVIAQAQNPGHPANQIDFGYPLHNVWGGDGCSLGDPKCSVDVDKDGIIDLAENSGNAGTADIADRAYRADFATEAGWEGSGLIYYEEVSLVTQGEPVNVVKPVDSRGVPFTPDAVSIRVNKGASGFGVNCDAGSSIRRTFAQDTYYVGSASPVGTINQHVVRTFDLAGVSVGQQASYIYCGILEVTIRDDATYSNQIHIKRLYSGSDVKAYVTAYKARQ